MTAFAVTTAACLFYPSWAPFLLLFSFSIGASRVLLGMHFLSDVLAAMVIGGGIGYLSYRAFAL